MHRREPIVYRTMKVYIFSGLGADERVFEGIDWQEFEPVFIPWLRPRAKESMEKYALRMSAGISGPEPLLLGMSFGGMMAVEVSKHVKASRIVLLSSAKNRNELPWYFKLIGCMRLHRAVPPGVLKSSSFITHWFFGTKTEEEKQTLRTILRETDPVYLRWAIDAVLRWKNRHVPENLVHIHGTADRILPYRFVNCDFAVRNGRHFMVVSERRTVNALLLQSLRQE